MRFLNRFWSAALSLSGLVALYLAALALSLVWVFWAVLGTSAIYAFVRVIAPRGLTYIEKVRNYDSLLEQAARSQTEVQRLHNDLKEVKADLTGQAAIALAEGRKELLGALLAGQASVTPSLLGLDLVGTEVVVIASWTTDGGPAVGARYAMETKASGSLRGILEIVEVDREAGRARMACIKQVSEPFWLHLQEQAEINSNPPTDVLLSPTKVESGDLAVLTTVQENEPRLGRPLPEQNEMHIEEEV